MDLVGLQVSATSPKIAHKTPPDDATRTQRAPTLDRHVGNHYSIYVEIDHQVISYLKYIYSTNLLAQKNTER